MCRWNPSCRCANCTCGQNCKCNQGQGQRRGWGQGQRRMVDMRGRRWGNRGTNWFLRILVLLLILYILYKLVQ